MYLWLEEHQLIREETKEKKEERRETTSRICPLIADLIRLQKQQATKPIDRLYFR